MSNLNLSASLNQAVLKCAKINSGCCNITEKIINRNFLCTSDLRWGIQWGRQIGWGS